MATSYLNSLHELLLNEGKFCEKKNTFTNYLHKKPQIFKFSAHENSIFLALGSVLKIWFPSFQQSVIFAKASGSWSPCQGASPPSWENPGTTPGQQVT